MIFTCLISLTLLKESGIITSNHTSECVKGAKIITTKIRKDIFKLKEQKREGPFKRKYIEDSVY